MGLVSFVAWLFLLFRNFRRSLTKTAWYPNLHACISRVCGSKLRTPSVLYCSFYSDLLLHPALMTLRVRVSSTAVPGHATIFPPKTILGGRSSAATNQNRARQVSPAQIPLAGNLNSPQRAQESSVCANLPRKICSGATCCSESNMRSNSDLIHSCALYLKIRDYIIRIWFLSGTVHFTSVILLKF